MILWSDKAATSMDYSVSPPVPVAKPVYAGATLGTTGRDVRIMSDVWAWMTFARVWDGAKVIEVPVGDSEFGADAKVVVDATPEVLAAVAAWEAAKAAAAAKAATIAHVDRLVDYAKKVTVGKDVTVVKGRKVAKGTTGRVFWLGSGRFGYRVGLTDAAGATHWTALSNVEVTNPDDYMDVTDAVATLAAA